MCLIKNLPHFTHVNAVKGGSTYRLRVINGSGRYAYEVRFPSLSSSAMIIKVDNGFIVPLNLTSTASTSSLWIAPGQRWDLLLYIPPASVDVHPIYAVAENSNSYSLMLLSLLPSPTYTRSPTAQVALQYDLTQEFILRAYTPLSTGTNANGDQSLYPPTHLHTSHRVIT